MSMLIYDTIFDELKNNGFDTYAPDTHEGICVSPYVVVKETTTTPYQGTTTTITLYDVMCYAKNYSECISLKNQVKAALKKIQYTVMPTFNETTAFYDKDIKAYMSSVEYRNYIKINTF